MPRRSWRDLAADPPPGPSPAPRAPDTSADTALLRRVVPDGSPLAGLLAEREQLRSVLEGLTGPGGTREDPRFPVTGLRERRAEIASWAAARDALGSGRRRGLTGSGKLGAGPDRFIGAGTAARSQLLDPPRTGLGRYDQVRSALERSAEVLDRPRDLADGIGDRWEQLREQITGPMDRVGPYAEARDRVLDLDTGGSGDLVERAESARRRALAQRAERGRTARRAARREVEQRDAERLDRRTATGKGV